MVHRLESGSPSFSNSFCPFPSYSLSPIPTDHSIYQRSRLDCGVMPCMLRRWLTILLIVVVVSNVVKRG